MSEWDDVWERVRIVADWSNQRQLAKYLEIKPQAVSGAKSRGVFPKKWIEKIANDFNINKEWITEGVGLPTDYGAPNLDLKPFQPGFDDSIFEKIHIILESNDRQAKGALYSQVNMLIDLIEKRKMVQAFLRELSIKSIREAKEEKNEP